MTRAKCDGASASSFTRHANDAPSHCGVSDGTRTRDIQDHNLTLYQLNYTHHGRASPESLRA